MAEASNVTKFNAGGSGDNIIADGYIRTVEKVWLDSYTIAFTNTNTTIGIAVIPENKKITSIVVDIYTTASQTNGTVSIGYSTDATVASFLAPTTISHNATRTTIQLPGSFVMTPTATSSTVNVSVAGGFQAVTSGTATTISVKLNNWTMTTGTLKTIVRYT